MGKGGWLDRPFENEVNRTIYRRRRSWETKWSSASSIVESHRWNHSGIRPQAFPLRRWIWFGYATRHLKGTWRDWMETHAKPQLKQNSIRTPLARSLLSMFHLDSTRYWSTHYTRSDGVHEGTPKPVGTHWMDQLLVNVVLPWFYSRALESGNGAVSDRVMRQLRRYPPVLTNRRTRRIKRQWGLEDTFQWDNVLEQQAAVFLYKHGCVVDRCEQCSFNRREDDQLRLIDRRR